MRAQSRDLQHNFLSTKELKTLRKSEGRDLTGPFRRTLRSRRSEVGEFGSQPNLRSLASEWGKIPPASTVIRFRPLTGICQSASFGLKKGEDPLTPAPSFCIEIGNV